MRARNAFVSAVVMFGLLLGLFGGAAQAAATVTKTYNATGLPKTITFQQNNGMGGVTTSYLHVPDVGIITDVNVSVNIAYWSDQWLTVGLFGPDHYDHAATLAQYCKDGPNFTRTVFDQQAGTAFADGNPPYSGSFRPTESLATFNGASTVGDWDWELTVSNGAAATGTLNSWSLTITYIPTYTLSGTVRNGGSGLSGVTLTLSGDSIATTTTDGNGNYRFGWLPAGNYTVTPSKPDCTFTNPSESRTISADTTGVNFTATRNTYSIAGTARANGAGMSGVTMTLSPGGATTTTDGNGAYSFAGLLNGSYTVTPTPPAPYHFSPTSTGVTLGPSAANVDFAIVAPAAPTMSAEPPYTPGLGNTVGWGAVADADDYYVEWSTTNFGAAVGNSGWVTTTATRANNLTDGQTYYFHVKARNGGGESGWSNVVFSTQDNSPPTSSVIAPTTNQYALSFPVTWTCSDATSGVAFTRLYYSSDGGANYHQFGGDFTGTSTTFTSPDGYGTYSLYTRATDTVGNAEGAPGGPDATFRVIAAPLAPSMTAEPAYTKGASNNVSWSAVADADAYYVEWSTANFGAAVGNSGWTAGTNATATGLGDGAKYCYRVKARNGGGESGWSNVVSSTQDASAPSSCLCPLADQANLSFPISWTAADAVSGVGCTHLYYRVNGGALAQFGGDWVGTSATFTSPAGPGCYSFYTCADDRVGNCEGPPTTPDLTIQVGVGNVLTWNPVTHNLKLGPVDLAASGWYNLAKPAGAQVYVTVTGKSAGAIGGALSKYDANGGAHTDAVMLQPANSLAFQWQLRNGALYTLTESSAVGSTATSAMYSSATNKTMIGATTKAGAWELTQTLTPPASVAVGSQQFVP